jgi:hypothetical protein
MSLSNKEIALIVDKLSSAFKQYIDIRMNKAATVIYKKLKEELDSTSKEDAIEESLNKHFGKVLKESDKNNIKSDLIKSDFKFELPDELKDNDNQPTTTLLRKQQAPVLEEQVNRGTSKAPVNGAKLVADVMNGKFDDVQGVESIAERIDYRQFLNTVDNYEKKKSTGGY